MSEILVSTQIEVNAVSIGRVMYDVQVVNPF